MTFDLIFISLLLAGWLICAYLPWVAASVLSRGHTGFAMLPLSLFAGVVAAIAVPILGADGTSGLWASFPVAAAVPSLLLILRRATVSLRHAPTPPTSLPSTEQGARSPDP